MITYAYLTVRQLWPWKKNSHVIGVVLWYELLPVTTQHLTMMTSSNGNIFRVTGPLCGEFTGPSEFPTQSPVTRSFDVCFDLRLNKRLSKQSWGWWFETLSWSLWRQCNAPPLHLPCKTYRHSEREKIARSGAVITEPIFFKILTTDTP